MKKEITIGEIVAVDYRAASLFKEAGIDFCNVGKQCIEQVCSQKGIDPTELTAKLEKLKSVPNTTTHNFID
jgi:regulator of cell morphogenesis and NO signaling